MKNEGGKIEEIVWDVAVIGGGPAGMMAAARAAERGARVVLLEKNEGLGKKLLITGGGRCNVTNGEHDDRKLLEKFGEAGKYLFSTFSQWSVDETLNFFWSRGMQTWVENELRIFPLSNKAESVWQVLVDYLKQNKVEIISKAEVIGLEQKNGLVTGAILKNKKVIRAKNFILATGGKSHPETGSTGEGFAWLATLGHTIINPTASLVPIKSRDEWVKKLQGVTLKDIKITLYQNGVKQTKPKVGKILFTHFGVSGPTILNLSSEVGELLKYGEVIISLDLFPKLSHETVDDMLQKIHTEHSAKMLKNSLAEFIMPALVSGVLEMAQVNGNAFGHTLGRESRLEVVKTLKALPIRVSGLLGEDKAIVTSGGVKLDEVNFKTMSSRLIPNLHLVGDLLNINRPSGGFSLQLCWTTGYVAGNSILI